MKKAQRMIHHELQENVGFRGKLFFSMREIVFGLEDGIVSTLGAITGIAGGTENTSIVILSGAVIIFVESLSMAAGTFLSSKSEREVEERMLDEERMEIEQQPDLEKKELEDFYHKRGFNEIEIRILVDRITQDKDLWLEEMAFKELGVIPHKKEAPKTAALVMGVSYIIGGAVPLSAYLYLPIHQAIIVSLSTSVIILFLIGYAKGALVCTNKIRSGLEMMIVSLSAAGVGYFIGKVLSSILPL